MKDSSIRINQLLLQTPYKTTVPIVTGGIRTRRGFRKYRRFNTGAADINYFSISSQIVIATLAINKIERDVGSLDVVGWDGVPGR